jgi:hypothetical protein
MGHKGRSQRIRLERQEEAGSGEDLVKKVKLEAGRLHPRWTGSPWKGLKVGV